MRNGAPRGVWTLTLSMPLQKQSQKSRPPLPDAVRAAAGAEADAVAAAADADAVAATAAAARAVGVATAAAAAVAVVRCRRNACNPRGPGSILACVMDSARHGEGARRQGAGHMTSRGLRSRFNVLLERKALLIEGAGARTEWGCNTGRGGSH